VPVGDSAREIRDELTAGLDGEARALGLPVDREAAICGEPLAHHASRLRAAQGAG
jgi:hypothetical protein